MTSSWERPLDERHARIRELNFQQVPTAESEDEVYRLLNECEDPECMDCGRAVCPHAEPLHFHHDGCPACYFEELAAESKPVDPELIARARELTKDVVVDLDERLREEDE